MMSRGNIGSKRLFHGASLRILMKRRLGKRVPVLAIRMKVDRNLCLVDLLQNNVIALRS